MTRVLSRVLGAVGRIYKPVGGQIGYNELEMDGPIQPVHNLSREAELGAGAGNYFGFHSFSLVNTHAVAVGNVGASQAIYPPAPFYSTLGVGDQDYWTWLMDASVRSSTSLVFDRAVLSILQGVVTGAMTDHAVSTHYWDSVTGVAIDLDPGLTYGGIRIQASPVLIGLPRLIPRGSSLCFVSRASGAISDVILQATLYTCPIGTLPPGLA